METTEELQEFLERATQENVRGRLLDRAEARAIIRRNGILPEDAPPLGDTLDTDLSEYGFSLLRAALATREQEGEPEVWQPAFFTAGRSFESLVRNGSEEIAERGFWRVMGAASYHLAGYSAMAFSLMHQQGDEPNFAPAELALVRLLLRDLSGLRGEAQDWLRDPAHQDDTIARLLAEREIETDDAVVLILTAAIYKAFAYFEFALAAGSSRLVEEARGLLGRSLNIAQRYGSVSLWWVIRISLHVIDDLWANSLHCILPREGPPGAENYADLRELFLASLYAREISEIELWPSQLDAARRATDIDDDLVVSLPTSAGKTRVAEICALMTLSTQKRVLILTPLRALSAQTERLFRKIFGPLGFSVSSLYGASGMIPGDDDAFRLRHIVIATPEKLDFALRNDPSLINDVGLIVLDEGHLIGPGDREIRYETLVQRLLHRADADERRIICLSAILPDGEQLDDLTGWIRNDADGDAIKSTWRPTRQRYGTLTWAGNSATLKFDFDDDGPFIQGFVEQQPAIRPRRNPFPWVRQSNQELTLAAAWQIAEDGKRTLVFCTQRDNVESYAGTIVDLARRGFLPSLLADGADVSRAKIIGAEWLGAGHPAVECLDVGVAIHHARLPSAFRREIERLLNEDVLTVTVASPTLAQGLNLNAAVLLVPRLDRAGIPLTGEEFANIAGRAGRAFVDLEGLIVNVIHKPEQRWRMRRWRELVNESRARNLESGLVLVAAEILHRLARGGILDRDDAFEYLANNREAWTVEPDDLEDEDEEEEPIENLIEKLDSIILGLVEALDSDAEDLPQLIDDALNGSLWARQIVRRAEGDRENQLDLLKARSRLIWSSTTAQQRRGHFAMGVGLEAGLSLDEMADDLAASLDLADDAALRGDVAVLQENVISLAERLLRLRPFAPDDPLPANWQDVLSSWLAGVPVRDLGPENMRMIEDSFTYRLIWAIEAVRMRRLAAGWEPDFISGGAAAGLEAGVPRYMMAMLVRAGLPSRAAAIEAINDQEPVFVDNAGLSEWLESNEIAALTDQDNWPTAETNEIWRQFRNDVLSGGTQRWTSRQWRRNIDRESRQSVPETDRPYRVQVEGDGTVWVSTPDFRPVLKLRRNLRDRRPSVLTAIFEEGSDQAIIRRLGRSRARWPQD